jgi:hypothetical protein
MPTVLYSSPNVIGMIKARRRRLARYSASMAVIRGFLQDFVSKV